MKDHVELAMLDSLFDRMGDVRPEEKGRASLVDRCLMRPRRPRADLGRLS